MQFGFDVFLDVSFHADLRAFIHKSNLFRLWYQESLLYPSLERKQQWFREEIVTEMWVIDFCWIFISEQIQSTIIIISSSACHQTSDWFLFLCLRTDSDHRSWIWQQKMIDLECLSSYRFRQSSISIITEQVLRFTYNCSSWLRLEHGYWVSY